MTPSEKVVLSYKRFYFVKVHIFAEGEQKSYYCLSLTRDSKSESGESVNLIRSIPPLRTGQSSTWILDLEQGLSQIGSLHFWHFFLPWHILKQEIQKKLGWVESWPLKITGEETKAVSVNIFSWGLIAWLATNVRPALGVCKAHPCPFIQIFMRNGTLLPKLFWPTERKNCSSD